VKGSVSASNFQAGDASALTVIKGTLARTLAARFGEVVNAADYGAKCDGSTDDTTAFAAAISAAEARIVSEYWMPSGLPEVSAPPGLCFTSGIVIHKPIWFHGAGASGTTLALMAGSNVSVVKVVADAQTDPTPWAGHTTVKLSDFAIDGNSSNQTGTSHGIELADASYSQGARYGSGARLSDINVYSTKNHGIYVGTNRNFGWMDRIIINYAQNDCVNFNGNNDWDLSGLSVGACAYNGIEIYYSGQIKIVNLDAYNNGGDGIKLKDGFGGYLFINNATIGANCGHGIEISPSSVVVNAIVGLSNIQLVDNSLCNNNSSSHIYVRNLNSININNVIFSHSYTSGNNSKYLIDNDAVTNVQAFNLTYATNGSYVPFVTANFANLSRLTATSALSGGGFGVSGYIATSGYTVSTLPSSPPAGARAFVTDAAACSLNGALTGGGSIKCPVWYNGSAWLGG
jgi:hypothetical protein